MKLVIERVLEKVSRVPFSGCWIFTGAVNDLSKHPLSKLSEEQVLVIRKAYQDIGWTQQEIAIRYGVARQTISKVVNGKRFKHV